VLQSPTKQTLSSSNPGIYAGERKIISRALALKLYLNLKLKRYLMKNTELLMYMLDDIRKETIKGISGLTKEQLFMEPVKGEYPIGAYMMHIAEAELYWLGILSGEKQPEELKKRVYDCAWFDAPQKSYAPPAEPIEIDEYLNVAAEIRDLFFKYISSMNDSDLETKLKIKRSATHEVEITKKWIIYHILEHEAHTRGQMFLLIRMAGFKKKGENN
jgi:uncharacterized damage-inducible protein DinB